MVSTLEKFAEIFDMNTEARGGNNNENENSEFEMLSNDMKYDTLHYFKAIQAVITIFTWMFSF